MKTAKKFITNGIILTVTSLFLRFVGILFNTYISNCLGSEGMGVYSLVQSVFGFAVTFACSGINLGATRLISEAIAKDNCSEIRNSVKLCVLYSLFFSGIATVVVFLNADFIGASLLGDVRTVKSIKILSVALPFISLSSVFNGYFSAVRKVYKNAIVMVTEQFVRIFVTVNIISSFYLKGVECACIAVALGTLVSEICSLGYNVVLWRLDSYKKNKTKRTASDGLTKKLFGISIPLALSTYIRSGLITVEHLLIPYGLRKNGVSYALSMSTYGIIQGMVFPLIMFPSCLIYSFSGLLIPEFAALNEVKDRVKINKGIEKVIQYSLLFSIGVASVILCYSYELSMVFYNSAEAYEYIKLFAPLVSIMYLDGAIDGILKGMNEQLHSMKINIADAFISVVLVYFLVPQYGVKGYITAIFVSEIFNCSMSLLRLVKISNPELSIMKFVVKPIVFAIISVGLVVFVFNSMNITEFGSKLNLFVRILCTAVIYLFLIFWNKNKKRGYI